MTYIRNMADCGARAGLDPLVQKCWQKMFANESEARRNCKLEDFECSWDSAKRLRIVNTQPFVRNHPAARQVTRCLRAEIETNTHCNCKLEPLQS